MPIKEYLNKMKINHIGANNKKCMINGHNKNFECYCLECNSHLCEICLKSREHLSHYKIIIKEVMPSTNELNMIDNIIKDIENKKEYKNLKNLYEIIYNTYTKANNNYYYCINVNFILVNYIENNKSFKNKIKKEEYDNIIKIKNSKARKNKIDDELINKILEENEQMKKKYENTIINLQKKLSEEINKLNKQGFIQDNPKINDDNYKNKNIIEGKLDIKLNEIKNKIVLFNTEIKNGIDVYLNNKKINMIQDNKLWKIDYNFEKDGKYTFQIVFNNIITNMIGFFEKCPNIISLDFSNFNTENVTDMSFMFNECH